MDVKGFDASTVLQIQRVDMNWKTIKKGDYLYGLAPDHPNCTENGYVLEHRLVVERALNRFLASDEIVHHVNEDKHDNSLENLQVMSRCEHNKHHKRPLKLSTFTCPNCGTEFSRRPKGKAEVSEPKCSRKCNGEYLHKARLD